jgi:LPS O-antigen subunit length determinant protein (WzzB/FepE family)
MQKKLTIHNNEIDLIQIAKNLWKSKWKIAVVTIISAIVLFTFQNIKSNPTKNFIAKTQVLPVSASEADKYSIWNNNFNIKTSVDLKPDNKINKEILFHHFSEVLKVPDNKINKEILFQHFSEVLKEKELFIEAMHKYSLLDVNQYKNEEAYKEAVANLASLIKFETLSELNQNLSEINDVDKIMNILKTNNMVIIFKYHDQDKWKDVLKYVDEAANKIVKNRLQNKSKSLILIAKQNREYLLEDISVKIENLINDYDRKMSDRILYLNEQSAIAKKLGIAKNTIEVQTFGNQNTLLSNVQTDAPFYLRGYEAIDKEIELINARINKKAFIKGLLRIEQQKRAVEQNKSLERAIINLELSPLGDNNRFKAASIKTLTTKFQSEDQNINKIKLPIFILFGLIIGVFYVVIIDAFKSHNPQRKE